MPSLDESTTFLLDLVDRKPPWETESTLPCNGSALVVENQGEQNNPVSKTDGSSMPSLDESTTFLLDLVDRKPPWETESTLSLNGSPVAVENQENQNNPVSKIDESDKQKTFQDNSSSLLDLSSTFLLDLKDRKPPWEIEPTLPLNGSAVAVEHKQVCGDAFKSSKNGQPAVNSSTRILPGLETLFA